MTVPRVIYSLWLQGEVDRPELVRLCLARWSELNPEHELRVLDSAAVEELLADEPFPVSSLSPQALSDVVRAKLLLREGGVWVDATVLPTRPLDTWLPALVEETGFFAFDRPGPDRPLASWFLAASPGHVVLKRWWEEIKRFWSLSRPVRDAEIPADPVAAVAPETAEAGSYPYFWFHYLFAYLMEHDAEVAGVWSRSARVSADIPHRLQSLFRDNQSPGLAQLVAAATGSPVHKLNWRAAYPLEFLAGIATAGLACN